MSRVRVVAAATVACISLCAAHAGALRVGPTRVELTRQKPVAVIEVRNDNQGPMLVQIERMAWTQQGGDDQYEPTQKLIVTPPVIQLQSGSTQIVRLALRAAPQDGPLQDGQEQAFRVYVREVLPETHQEKAGIQVALRIGVPVFMDADGATPSIHWLVQEPADGQLRILARNDGNHWEHLQKIEARLTRTGGVVWQATGAGYLLAGGQRVWTGSATGVVRVGDQLDVIATTDTGERHEALDISP